MISKLGTPEQELDIARRAMRKAAEELMYAASAAVDGGDIDCDDLELAAQEFLRARKHRKKLELE